MDALPRFTPEVHVDTTGATTDEVMNLVFAVYAFMPAILSWLPVEPKTGKRLSNMYSFDSERFHTLAWNLWTEYYMFGTIRTNDTKMDEIEKFNGDNTGPKWGIYERNYERGDKRTT